jgi:hypothetical protein
MNKQMVKMAGTQVVADVVRRRVDIALGFALLRDRRIPLAKKALALVLGTIGMFVIQALEIPLEMLTLIFGSPIGVEDGIEAIVWPVLLACAILPYLLPQALVDVLRAERAQHV